MVAEPGAVNGYTVSVNSLGGGPTGHVNLTFSDPFGEAELMVTRTEGGLAVKPEMKKGWKTYNFEVAEHHTYIADGGNPAANDNFRGRAAA